MFLITSLASSLPNDPTSQGRTRSIDFRGIMHKLWYRISRCFLRLKCLLARGRTCKSEEHSRFLRKWIQRDIWHQGRVPVNTRTTNSKKKIIIPFRPNKENIYKFSLNTSLLDKVINYDHLKKQLLALKVIRYSAKRNHQIKNVGL